MYARVWENRYCITCIICVRIAGAAWRLQAYARQFGQVEGRTEVYPVVSLFHCSVGCSCHQAYFSVICRCQYYDTFAQFFFELV